MSAVILRPATLDDFPAIWEIFQHVITEGETYSYGDEFTREQAIPYWLTAPTTHSVVAELDGKVAGVYALRTNRLGRANHIANGSFMVAPWARKQGIARKLGQDFLKQAKELGYQAAQFNFVVSTNTVAVNLWKSLGFVHVGTSPKGFQHPRHGLVDVYILHQFL